VRAKRSERIVRSLTGLLSKAWSCRVKSANRPLRRNSYLIRWSAALFENEFLALVAVNDDSKEANPSLLVKIIAFFVSGETVYFVLKITPKVLPTNKLPQSQNLRSTN
jgi:hypothetical protein